MPLASLCNGDDCPAVRSASEARCGSAFDIEISCVESAMSVKSRPMKRRY